MKIDVDLIKRFEESIDTVHPETGKIPIHILGYGEISLVFEIIGDVNELAYKRIPIFDTEKQVKRHLWAYKNYNEILENKIGLNIPDYDALWFKDSKNKIQFYCVQKKVPPESVCNKLIHHLSKDQILSLVHLILKEFKKVWSFNESNLKIDVGLDGQISNFALMNYTLNNIQISADTKLYYFDTSTPMVRINGNEGMEAVLFLKSAPSFIRFLLKALFLEETVGRYYDLRKVTIDLIANFFKEQMATMIPPLITFANDFYKNEAPEFEVAPINFEEVLKYYKSDADMWKIFQSVRKADRYVKTRIFHQSYDFYLPGEIKR
jgi:hypothetical protein